MIGREKREKPLPDEPKTCKSAAAKQAEYFRGEKRGRGGVSRVPRKPRVHFIFLSFLLFFFLSVYQKLTPEHRGQGNPTLWIYVNTFRCSGRTVLLLSSSLLPRLVVEWSRHPSKMSSGKAPRVQGLKKSKASTNPDRALPKGAVAGQVTANSRLLPDVF